MMNFIVAAVRRIIKIYMVTVFILFNAILGIFLLSALLDSISEDRIMGEVGESPGQAGQIVAIEPGSEEHIERLHEWAYRGYAPTQYDLGVCYEKGEGVTQDIKKAMRWYRKAAQQGDKPAIKALQRLQNEVAKNKQQDDRS